MTTWTSDELDRIADAEELEIQSQRDDGTLRKAVPIWVVRAGDDVYVRSYKGDGASWYRSVRARHEGHVQAGGVAKDVTFVDVGADEASDQVDAAYLSKYGRFGTRLTDPMVTAQARAATVKLVPR